MDRWKTLWQCNCAEHNNFIFLGEAGSGKSEIALNLAFHLASCQEKPVHFFDLDMTKPLFRSRDLYEKATAEGICFHYEEQFMDAPTQVGGVRRLLQDPDCFVILDIGGDDIGAREVGGYAPWLNQPQTMAFFVVNPFRPWSGNIDHIDETLGKILGVSHVGLDQIHIISNPNNSGGTTLTEFLDGHRQVLQMICPYHAVDFVCCRKALYPKAQEECGLPVMPLQLYLQYSWLAQQPAEEKE